MVDSVKEEECADVDRCVTVVLGIGMDDDPILLVAEESIVSLVLLLLGFADRLDNPLESGVVVLSRRCCGSRERGEKTKDRMHVAQATYLPKIRLGAWSL